MKKSIFLFFAAILCAIGMNAADIPAGTKFYLKPNSNWGGARYAVYFYGNGDAWVSMQLAPGETNIYEVTSPNKVYKNLIFCRMNPDASANNWDNKWNQTNDLTYDGTKNFYTVKEGTWDKGGGTWSTYTYTPPTLYIAGDFVTPNWDPAAAANKMEYADGVYSKSYDNVAPSAHQFKITNGTWTNAIGYNSNTCSGTNCKVEGNGENIQFTPLAEGSVTITYTLAGGKVHITCPEPPAAEHNITYPATQTNYTLTAGPEKAQAGAEVSFTATPAEGYVLNVTYNGNAITGNNNVYTFLMPAADVTIAIEAVAATTLYYVDNNSWGNANAYMWNESGNNGWPGAAMTSVGTVGDNAYSYYSVSFAQGTYTSIIFNNGSGSQTSDLTINTEKPYFYDGAWYTWDELLAKLAAPVVTYDYYVIGTINSWGLKDENFGMTDEDADGVYEKVITLADGKNQLKINKGEWKDGEIWGYDQLAAQYEGVSRGKDEDDNNIIIDITPGKDITIKFDKNTSKITLEGLTEKAPAPTYDYYLTGSLVGGWDVKQQGIEKDGELYKATFTELNAGTYEFKITAGDWEHQWNYNNLGAAYEEVSQGVDGEGKPNGNIKIVTEEAKNITVIFDATAGKITLEGLTPYVVPLTYTVTVPAGTEKCYIVGAFAQSNWNTFLEMDKVDSEDKFTITITGAKESDEYKYACQESWDYVEKDKDGNDLAGNRTWKENDKVENWGKPVIVTYQLKGVGGWEQPGIELVQNPDPEKASEYMLTCQAISATDAIKVVRLEDGVIKDYYGNGTVKDGVEVTVNYDTDGNITLPEGKYNFYFDTNEAEKKLWIAEATDCAPATATITLVDAKDIGATLTLSADEYEVGDEITASAAIYDDGFAFAYWKENGEIVSYNADYTFVVTGDHTLEAYFGSNMPVEMADLVVDTDAMTITGSNTTDGVTASLKLDNYDSDMEMWSVDATNSTLEWRSPMDGTPLNLTVLYGEVGLDMEAYSMAMAKVVADFGGELYVFNLTMTAASETLEVGVATELSLEFGALVMRGTWYDENDVEYPFEAQVGGFDYTKAEQEYMTTVSLGNFDDDTNWLGMAQGLMTVTVADGTVELTGTVTTMSPINTLNIVAQGMIEILDLNLDATVEEMDLGVDGKYLHLTAVDDEASGMDFDLYLNDYTGADGEYELNEMSTVAGGAAAATGSLTKSGNTYTGTLYAAAGTLYVFDLTLTEFVPEYENIVITGLSGAAEARYMGWGDEYYLALSLKGTWSDGVEYPVLLEITGGYDAAATSGTVAVSLTIGGMGDDDPWLGNAEGEMSYTLSGKNITLKGKMENPYGWPAAVYWDVNVSGTILPNYTRDVTAGNFGTLCLPFGGKVKGCVAYEIVGSNARGVILSSVDALEAGVPYIFKATADQIAAYCDATVADEAGNHNGLYGTFDDNTVVANGNYIIHENALCEVTATSWVNANRAWVVMDEVPSGEPTPMPGRKYITVEVTGENEATGVDNITTSENAVKTIVNGQLIIIRGGEKFNAQGQKL